MKNVTTLKTILCIWMGLLFIAPAHSIADGPFKPNKQSIIDNYNVPDWYRDAKFGIYLHWGPQAIPAIGDWYPKYMYMPDEPKGNDAGKYYNFHCKKYAHPSKFGYKDLCNEWKAEKFDPDSLVRYFRSIGAGWVCPMGSHHDGFDNWKSSYQEWNTVNVGPKKDLMRGWADAAKKYKMRLGMGYHKVGWAYDWLGKPANGSDAGGKYDGNLTKADGKGKWWDGMDPQRLYTTGVYWSDENIRKRWKNELWEAVVNYDLDLFWFDGGLDYGNEAWEFIADFYNKDYKDGAADHVMCLKDGETLPKKIMAYDYEDCTADDAIQNYPWEAHSSVSSWFYVEKASARSATKIITNIPDIASKNGCLHLNVGPMADGTIPKRDIDVMDKIGAWNKINGEGIFRTRPFQVYGEGPTKAQTKVYAGLTNGLNKSDIRFTRSKNGKILYVFFLGWPGDGAKANISKLSSSKLDKSGIKEVTMLGGSVCQWGQDGSGLTITMPSSKPAGTDHAYGFKIAFNDVIKYDGKVLQVFPETVVEISDKNNFKTQPVNPNGAVKAFHRDGKVIVNYDCGMVNRGKITILSLNGEVIASKAVSGSGKEEFAREFSATGIYLYRFMTGKSSFSGIVLKD